MPRYLYERVTDELRERISSGRYEPGERLPTRVALCAEFGVSDIVIGQAMRTLRAEGWVETLPGMGTFAAEKPPAR